MRSLFLLLATGSLLFLQACRGGGNSQETKPDSTTTMFSEFHDFESVKHTSMTTEKASSGKVSALLCDSIEYSFGLSKRFKEISSINSVDEINVSFKCFMDKQYPDVTFVISIDDSTETKNILWDGKPVLCAKPNEWNDIQYNFKLNRAFVTPESVLKLYIWNKGKNKFYFDDIAFDFVKVKK